MSRAFSRVKLGDIAESLDYGVTASAAWEPKGPKFLRITDIRNGQVDWSQVPWCECDTRAADKFRLHSGDIVFARTGTTGASFLVADCPQDSVFASYLIRLRLTGGVDPRYAAHFFRTADYWGQIKSMARGAIQSGVNATKLRNLSVPIPSLAKQQRIAEVLDQAEALRAKRREALSKLDELTQSVFLDMFGDQAMNPNSWPTIKIDGACKLVMDCVNKTAPVVEEPTPFKMIRTTNVKNGKVDLSDVRYVTEDVFYRWNRRAAPKSGDVLLTREAPVGEAGILDSEDNVFLGQRLMLYRVDPEVMTPQYLLWSFRETFLQRQFGKQGSGSTVKHISVPACRSLRVHVPPLDLQQKFARRVEAVERLKASHRAQLAELDELFASLQQRAFRGEM